jgi:hypothetical protein
MIWDGTYFTTTTPFIEFNIQFQSNSLIYDKGYSIRQQMIYCLIQFMKEEGMGYRRISKKLNQWGIKTHRAKNLILYFFQVSHFRVSLKMHKSI